MWWLCLLAVSQAIPLNVYIRATERDGSYEHLRATITAVREHLKELHPVIHVYMDMVVDQTRIDVVFHSMPADPIKLYLLNTLRLNGRMNGFYWPMLHGDRLNRVGWRSSICRDFITIIADRIDDDGLILWLEDDVLLRNNVVEHIDLFIRVTQLDVLSLYSPTPVDTFASYEGEGALALLFTRESLDSILTCVEARWILDPLDWIIADCHGVQSMRVDAAIHQNKQSTFIQ